jgi:hypothetical protein
MHHAHALPVGGGRPGLRPPAAAAPALRPPHTALRRPRPARCAPAPPSGDAEPGAAVSQLDLAPEDGGAAAFNPLEAMRATTDPRERAKLLQQMDGRWSECQVGRAGAPAPA